MRVVRVLGTAGLLCLTAFGCGGRSSVNQASAPPCETRLPATHPADTLTVVVFDEIDLSHAPRPTNRSERFVFSHLYQTLVNVDCHNQVRRGIAKSWKEASDGWYIEIEEDEVLKTRCRRVGIFLSVFDVHVNRAPIAGKITYTRHYPGTYPGPYLDARNPDCSKFNEALTWAFEGRLATLVVRQITGAIARRIVPWSKVGDSVEKAHRFGMIRFGSRTEIYLPLDAEVSVKVGDKVRGAETVIAHLK